MAKLNQIIAVANGQKGRTAKALTEVYHKIQKEPMISGISRRYRPKNEEGEQLPPESKRVHFRVEDALNDAQEALTKLFDVVATQDWANCTARADVVVDNEIILKAVPVTHLLFLEKQVGDVHTLVDKLPTLDPSEEWEFSEEANCYATPMHETTRTKKVPKAFVKYDATTEHPAQVEMFTEDEIVGHWETIKFSGAISETEKRAIVERVRKLQDAIKKAREEANSTDVEDIHIGENIFGYLFG